MSMRERATFRIARRERIRYKASRTVASFHQGVLTLCLFVRPPRQMLRVLSVECHKSTLPQNTRIFLAGKQKFYSVNMPWTACARRGASRKRSMAMRRLIMVSLIALAVVLLLASRADSL